MMLAGVAATSSAAPPVIDQFNWFDGDPLTADVDMLGWEQSDGGDYEQRDECDVDMPNSCDAFSAAGPFVRAGTPGTYPSGSSAGWVYTVPGGPDAYIKELTAWGANIQSSPTPTEPHAFLGLWNGSSWSALDTADETSALSLEEVEGEPGDRQMKFGMKADSTVSETDDHWAALATMTATLGDDVSPVLDYDTGAIPTGWVNEDPFTIPAPAYDEGLGLEYVVAFSGGRGATPWAPGAVWGDGWDANCDGNTSSPCPADSPNDFELEIRPAEIREGVNPTSLAAVDAMGNVSNDNLATVFDLKVDTIKPEVELTGSFMTAPGMVLDGPIYSLDSLATDGEFFKENSGVTDLKVLIDDVVIDSDSQSCPTENCDLGLDTDIDPDNYTNGDHVLKVKATDAVGHVKTETVEFEVDR